MYASKPRNIEVLSSRFQRGFCQIDSGIVRTFQRKHRGISAIASSDFKHSCPFVQQKEKQRYVPLGPIRCSRNSYRSHHRSTDFGTKCVPQSFVFQNASTLRQSRFHNQVLSRFISSQFIDANIGRERRFIAQNVFRRNQLPDSKSISHGKIIFGIAV